MTARLLTTRVACVLRLLATGDKYGLQLVAASDEVLKVGGVYALLQRLCNDALITGTVIVGTKGPRKMYSLTNFGRAYLEAHDAAEAVLGQSDHHGRVRR
jgi:DNA-binding PadR family transcriptional regulator